jgi:hypothetical protein
MCLAYHRAAVDTAEQGRRRGRNVSAAIRAVHEARHSRTVAGRVRRRCHAWLKLRQGDYADTPDFTALAAPLRWHAQC